MDAIQLFRKLGVGAKFNYKRFQRDAEKLQIRKPRNEEKDKTVIDSLTLSSRSSEKQDESNCKAIKRKVSDVDMLSDESETEMSDNELQLLGKIKSSGDAEKIKDKSRKKKKIKTTKKVALLKQEQVNHFRNSLKIHVHGSDVPDPIESFHQLHNEYSVQNQIIQNIKEMGYEKPTPIQSQAIPIMLHRREVLACAPTGSGKTAAFLVPVLHQLKEPRNKGFRALILSPTRELAQQTHRECQRLAEGRGFRIHLIEKTGSATKKFGPKSSQKFDILVTTPNRLVFLLKQDPPAISLVNVEWLIVDESDKLFEDGKTGFRDQLAVIYQACDGPKVKRALFSATFAHDVEEWCKLNLDNVLQVYVGGRNVATENIEQSLMFTGSESGKLIAMRDIVKQGLEPPVLIFVQSKERAKELFQELIYDGINVDVIHSDKTQTQRDNTVKAFRAGHIWVLICTELMGRGIDFKGVNLVINYDFPSSAVSYIHRIGRTGRAGRSGKAITFFTEDDAINLRSIANVMRGAGCPVPDYMLEINKPDKKKRRKLAKSVPYRKSIRTIPKQEIVKAKQRRKKMKKLASKQQSRDSQSQSTSTGKISIDDDSLKNDNSANKKKMHLKEKVDIQVKHKHTKMKNRTLLNVAKKQQKKTSQNAKKKKT